MAKQIDLYLNSTIGLWVADNIEWNLGEVYKYNKDSHLPCKEIDVGTKRYAAISVHWPKIFSQTKIESYKFFLNIHSGLLPESRGMYPVFWNVYENTKAGATVHQITSTLDYGPILFREEVLYSKIETCRDVWNKVFTLEKKLFTDTVKMLSNFPDTLPLKPPSGQIGLNRKAVEFLDLKNNFDKLALSSSDRYRLKLALDF
jgi:methionyl-tRNA formyltransferase